MRRWAVPSPENGKHMPEVAGLGALDVEEILGVVLSAGLGCDEGRGLKKRPRAYKTIIFWEYTS